MGVKVRGPMGYGAPEHPLAKGGTIPAGTVFEVDELEAERLVAKRGFEIVEDLVDLGDGDDQVDDVDNGAEVEPGDGEGDSHPEPDGAPAPKPAARAKAASKGGRAKAKGKGR